MRGKITFYKKDLGYGFIRVNTNKEYFFTYHEIIAPGYKTCNVGDEVEFEEFNTHRGLQAKKIRIINN